MPLNRKQQRAVEHVDGPLLVLAGAGSGKTRVITHKIANLVTRHGYAPHEVAAVTFTNKAAREMRQRVTSLIAPEMAEAVRISTFHTLGLNILRREYGHTSYRRNFSILDAGDSRALIRDRQTGGELDVALPQTGEFSHLARGQEVHLGWGMAQAKAFATSAEDVEVST